MQQATRDADTTDGDNCSGHQQGVRQNTRTREEHRRKQRQGVDRLGLRRRSRKRVDRGRRIPLRCGNSINGRRLERDPAEENNGAGGGTQEDEEAKDEIDLTQEPTDQEEAAPGTREWILEHHGPNEAVAWPTEVEQVARMVNPSRIRFDLQDVRTEKCGCADNCRLATCQNAMENQVCDSRTCTPGAAKCANRFRQQRLQLVTTRNGLGVVARRKIPAGAVVGQYWGKYSSTVAKNAQCTVQSQHRDVDGRRVYVCAEEQGSIARFMAHSCDANTSFQEVRGRKQVVVSLVAQIEIPAGEEVTVDYTGRSRIKLWFQCQCPAHKGENERAVRETKLKLERGGAGNETEATAEQ